MAQNTELHVQTQQGEAERREKPMVYSRRWLLRVRLMWTRWEDKRLTSWLHSSRKAQLVPHNPPVPFHTWERPFHTNYFWGKHLLVTDLCKINSAKWCSGEVGLVSTFKAGFCLFAKRLPQAPSVVFVWLNCMFRSMETEKCQELQAMCLSFSVISSAKVLRNQPVPLKKPVLLTLNLFPFLPQTAKSSYFTHTHLTERASWYCSTPQALWLIFLTPEVLHDFSSTLLRQMQQRHPCQKSATSRETTFLTDSRYEPNRSYYKQLY